MNGSSQTPLRMPWVINGSVERRSAPACCGTTGRIAELAVSTSVTSLRGIEITFLQQIARDRIRRAAIAAGRDPSCP